MGVLGGKGRGEGKEERGIFGDPYLKAKACYYLICNRRSSIFCQFSNGQNQEMGSKL